MKQRKGQKKGRQRGQEKGRAKARVAGRGTACSGGRRIPPPESELWPVWCRGKLWEPIVAKWFAGRCQLCAYSCRPSAGRRFLDKMTGLPTFLVCTNHPDSRGELRDVLPTETCRNFKARHWLPPRAKRAKKAPDAATSESDKRVRRIPLGHDLFAIVDARDYKWLSKYKWCAVNKNGAPYAARHSRDGRTIYMHREIMRAPKGMVVDHIDHNTLNNRRCNLRVCTPEQNQVNVGPHGAASGYVGVHRCGNKWEAGIWRRGVYYYLKRYYDPVEAAKVRDRKAWELHGPLAYINLPEELHRWLRQQARTKAKAQGRRR